MRNYQRWDTRYYHAFSPRPRPYLQPLTTKRAAWWQGALNSLSGVITVAVIFSIHADLLPQQTFLLIIPLVLYGITLSILWRQRLDRRAWDAITASDLEVCPNCNYQVRGIESLTQCPECGNTMTIDQVRKLWADAHITAMRHQPILRLSPESMMTHAHVTASLLLISLLLYVLSGVLYLLDQWLYFAGGLYALAICATTVTLVAAPLAASINNPTTR